MIQFLIRVLLFTVDMSSIRFLIIRYVVFRGIGIRLIISVHSLGKWI